MNNVYRPSSDEELIAIGDVNYTYKELKTAVNCYENTKNRVRKACAKIRAKQRETDKNKM